MSRLFSSFTSPYARKVRVIAALLHHELELVDGSAHRAELLALNPLGKVPTLVLSDGTVLYDSVVIVDHLLRLVGDTALVPAETSSLVKRWEALADGMCDLLIPAVMERRKSPERRDEQWIAAQLARVSDVLGRIEVELAGRHFAVGSTLTLADVALVAAFDYVRLREAALLEQRPALVSYAAALAAEYAVFPQTAQQVTP